MSYTIDYSDKTDREAVADILFHLGVQRFKILVKEIKKYADNEKVRQSFTMTMDFVGVQGRPAKAILNRYLEGGKAK